MRPEKSSLTGTVEGPGLLTIVRPRLDVVTARESSRRDRRDPETARHRPGSQTPLRERAVPSLLDEFRLRRDYDPVVKREVYRTRSVTNVPVVDLSRPVRPVTRTGVDIGGTGYNDRRVCVRGDDRVSPSPTTVVNFRLTPSLSSSVTLTGPGTRV